MTNRKNPYTQYGEMMGVGIQIAGMMVIPMLGGYWLDKNYDFYPWGSVLGAIVGFVGVFWEIYKLAVRANTKK